MGQLLSFFGIFTSVVYLCFTYWLVGDRLHCLTTMELNAVGDFFAGIFGPLAILWLVLGFFQQGQELRQNNEALKLQAAELKNSVDQQKELVNVARDQVAADLENIRFTKLQAENALFPIFVVNKSGGVHKGDELHALSLQVTNMGASVSDVNMRFTSLSSSEKHAPIMEKGNSVRLEVKLEGGRNALEGLEDVLTIAYTKLDGTVGSSIFLLEVIYRDERPSLKASRLA